MWQYAGVVRREEGLSEAIDEIAALKEAARRVDVRPTSEGFQDLAIALDLRSALASAEATVRGALERRESRGAHQRADYPAVEPQLRVNFITEQDEDGKLTVRSAPVHPIPDELAAWLEEAPALEVEGRLLE